MKKIRFLICVLASIAMSFPVAHADEGMWLLPLLKQQNIEQMKGLGLEICADDIYHPDSVSLKDAVVIFGGGCTGEVISPHGLILTNHHCGYDYIQAHSTVDNDLLTNGFWAKSRQEELPNPGLTVTFIDKIEEVTDYVEEELKKELDILKIDHQGSLVLFTARGTRSEIMAKIQEKNPLFSEVLPLTLEEIFISETEVAGYEIQNIFF